MPIKMVDCVFANNAVGISLPTDWDVDLEARSTRFINNGTAVEIRGKEYNVPKELLELISHRYKELITSGATPEEAVEDVSRLSPVKRFLQSKGVELAGLSVATAQLIAQFLMSS